MPALRRAAIVGIAGPRVLPEEAALLRAVPPAGVILFARNVEAPPQLEALIAALRRLLLDGAVILVDQEGGRVARLRPPHWAAHPPAGRIGVLFERDPEAGLRAAWLTGALIGSDCARAGIDVACAPVLDLRWPGGDDVVGDRAFSDDPEAVAALGGALAAGLLAAGVQPVVKHAPGHGRATVDSHLTMPRVEGHDLAPDLLPFSLNRDLPWAMSAHILYADWDAARPGTLSPVIVADIIRGRIGFGGVLVTDDLAMQALSGAPEERAAAALAAGYDIALYCPGDFAATERLLRRCPVLTPQAVARLAAARAMASAQRRALDPPALAAERAGLLGGIWEAAA